MAGLSKFLGVPLVPGLVQSQGDKSEATTVQSRFYPPPLPDWKVNPKF